MMDGVLKLVAGHLADELEARQLDVTEIAVFAIVEALKRPEVRAELRAALADGDDDPYPHDPVTTEELEAAQ